MEVHLLWPILQVSFKVCCIVHVSTLHGYITTGAGIFVNTGDGATNVVLPNNGIVITRNVGSGDRFNFQCRSGSIGTDVGDIIGLDGNALPIDSSLAGVTTGGLNIRRASPATVFIRNRAVTEPALTAAHEGVYTCRIPDETGNVVDVNIGVYTNGFNSKDKSSGWLHHARGSSQLAWCTVMQGHLNKLPQRKWQS